MSITDELRKWKGNIIADLRPEMVLTLRRQLNGIADRIDAEHEADVSTACRLAAGLDNDALSKRGYIALPVDADGVPIRPGDALTIFETGEHIRAYDIELYDDGRWLVCDEETMDSIHPDRLRHHHAPTVEDVLREFADRYLDYEGMPSAGRRGVGEALMDEYAARLRLAEGADACRE